MAGVSGAGTVGCGGCGYTLGICHGSGERAVGLDTGAMVVARARTACEVTSVVEVRAATARGVPRCTTGVPWPAAARVVACTWGGELGVLSPLSYSMPPVKNPSHCLIVHC